MEERELLSLILGYLYEIEKMDKIPSEKIKKINNFIELHKKKTEKSYDNEYNTKNEDNELMDGYDYDNDYDQQDPNFW